MQHQEQLTNAPELPLYKRVFAHLWKFKFQILVSLILLLALPLFIMLLLGNLFQVAGSYPLPGFLSALSVLSLPIINLVSYFKPKAQYFFIVSIMLMVLSATLHNQFWDNHNQDLCSELKANPTCTGDKSGWRCEDFPLNSNMGFVSGPLNCN